MTSDDSHRDDDLDLAALRRRGDPIADDAVAALVALGVRVERGENAVVKMRPLAARDRAVARFLDETARVPRWLDVRDHAAGRSAMNRNAPIAFLVLLAGSLVESFAVAAGANVLVGTGRLLRDPTNRIYETAALVYELLAGDMRVGGRAHDALLRVRLLHAFVRRFTTKRPDYDAAALGVPVNQADMLHTLLVFSAVLARGVVKLGAKLTRDEEASWCALWRAAGHYVGVDDDVAFFDLASEQRAYAQITATYDPDDGSRALAHAVLSALSSQPPFYLPKPAMFAIARTLAGDALADRLALTSSSPLTSSLVPSALARVWRGVDAIARRSPALAERAGLAFVERNRARVLSTMPTADYTFRTA